MNPSANGTGVSAQGSRVRRKNYARTPAVLDLPRLTEVQLRSFEWFKTEGPVSYTHLDVYKRQAQCLLKRLSDIGRNSRR